MTAKAAQAVFSIKPHHYPHSTPDLGDNYIEGYAKDKLVKRIFADKRVDAADPRGHEPLLFGSSKKSKRNPYVRAYVSPYAKDSRNPRGWGAPSLRASSGRRSARPYNPRTRRGGGHYRSPRPGARALRHLNRGPWEGRHGHRHPHHRERGQRNRGRRNSTPRGRGHRNPRSRTRRQRQRDRRKWNGGAGLLGMSDSFKKPIFFKKQFHPRVDYKSPSNRGTVPKSRKPEWNKLAKELSENKEDLEDAKEDTSDAVEDGLDPATIVDDGKLGTTEGLKLPVAIPKYEKNVAELRKKIEAIPLLFPDKGLLGGSFENSWDDIIPEKVVNGVYKNLFHHYPEGEPMTDFMHNGWDGLNGVADP